MHADFFFLAIEKLNEYKMLHNVSKQYYKHLLVIYNLLFMVNQAVLNDTTFGNTFDS